MNNLLLSFLVYLLSNFWVVGEANINWAGLVLSYCNFVNQYLIHFILVLVFG